MDSTELHLALAKAAQQRNQEEIRALVAEGADLDASGALGKAVQRGDLEICLLLLDLGANPSLALYDALWSLSLNPLVHILLERGADPNFLEYEAITPLFPASGRNGSAAAVKALIDAGANIHHRCVDGENPLTWAASQRDWRWDPENNPLETLLDAGADPDVIDDWPNVWSKGRIPAIALIAAAREGNWLNLRILLHRGADPNLMDGTGDTALHVAAAAGHLRMVHDLLEAGADPEMRNGEGLTARQLAHRHCNSLMSLVSKESAEG